MIVKETILEGCFVIQPKVIQDKRGYFLESFNQAVFKEGLKRDIHFVQDNESYSSKGVLRGLHYQIGDYAQAKLVRVIKGKILDVVVDLRQESETFMQWFSIVLTKENRKSIHIAPGCANAFLTLEDNSLIHYYCSKSYNPDSERGIRYDDPSFNFQWPVKPEVISDKDLGHPNFSK